jgi:DnaK suppressor protein
MKPDVREALVNELRRQREAIFKEVADTEADLACIAGDRQSELEERASEDRVARLLTRLDDRGKHEIELIDLALQRISAGSYGVCVACRHDIPLARLRALPATPHCVKCASKAEVRSIPEEEAERLPGRAPSDIGVLSDRELEQDLWEEIRADGRVDLDELRIVCRRGVVHLAGALPSQAERQILLGLIKDVAGLEDVVDRIEIQELLWEREDRGKRQAAGVRPPGTEPAAGTEDVVEAEEEGFDFVPPAVPTPEEE